MIILSSPVEVPEKLPRPPESRFIRFITTDIRKLYKISSQCFKYKPIKLCVTIKRNKNLMDFPKVNMRFIWKFKGM